jgi:hypothetical protein
MLINSPFEGVVHHLAGLRQFSLPQVHPLLGEGRHHFVPEKLTQLPQQLVFAGDAKHL